MDSGERMMRIMGISWKLGGLRWIWGDWRENNNCSRCIEDVEEGFLDCDV